MSHWISVERRERPSGSVLVLAGSGSYCHMIQGFWDENDEEWYDDNDGNMIYHVSHWTTLPELPK